MSVALPVVAVVFGSVTPPQGDVKELQVHLGCTEEVSSFECLLANFNKKYIVTNPINVGDNGSISIGRGANCPLIATIRVEEIRCESTPVENYMRVRGRCWGEKLFRRVVTKTYENQKGEAIVKDLIDYYVGLSHVRDSTELIENTDTTYTKLEYENTPVFDILKYIAGSADKAGVIGFDFRVEPDAKFAFFPRNSKTSPINLSELIEVSEYRKDIHRIRNKIWVYGAAERKDPTNEDEWTDWTDPAANNWYSTSGSGTISSDSDNKKFGNRSVKHHMTVAGVENSFRFDYYGKYGVFLNTTKYKELRVWVRCSQDCTGIANGTWIRLIDGFGYYMDYSANHSPPANTWVQHILPLGPHASGWSGMSAFDWSQVTQIKFYFWQPSAASDAWVDWLFFGKRRWEAMREDTGSQTAYGLRELTETDEELHSDNECDLRAKALLAHLENPAEYITVRSTVIDYGTNPILPGDKIHVTLPNENIDADYRIISVEYRVTAAEQTLETTLELGKETPLLADYLYALRSKTGSLARTKAGK